MSIRTRFAPSPTGRLHLGHALAARVAHDLARRAPGGVFLLRFEDIDTPRVRDVFYQNIPEDLAWLGMAWDGEPLRQSSRAAAYHEALATLRERGMVYPCFCTRGEIQEEWAAMAAAPHGPEGPAYPGTCLGMSAAESADRIAAGAPHAWRLDSRRAAEATGPLVFHDLLHGTVRVDPGLLGDVVLARKQAGAAYHLAVVVDDAFQGITHVTRGSDLLPSTHVHRTLQALLDLPAPLYLHHPLVLDDHGKRLAKRHDALSLAHLRGSGLTAAELLARIPCPFLPEQDGLSTTG